MKKKQWACLAARCYYLRRIMKSVGKGCENIIRCFIFDLFIFLRQSRSSPPIFHCICYKLTIWKVAVYGPKVTQSNAIQNYTILSVFRLNGDEINFKQFKTDRHIFLDWLSYLIASSRLRLVCVFYLGRTTHLKAFFSLRQNGVCGNK